MNGQCEGIERLIIDYVLGELDRSDAEVVEKHVSGCPACSEALREVQRIRSALSQQELVEPPARVCESVRNAARGRVVGPRGATSALADLAASFVRRPILAGASAVVAIAVITLLVVLPGERPPVKHGPSPPQPIELRGKVLWEFEGYLSRSQEIMRSAIGPRAADLLADYTVDDWKNLIGQAMDMKKIEGLRAYWPLLRDLEILYRTIIDCKGSLGEEEIRRIRQLISGRNLVERTTQAVSPER